jgi:rhodanese-related sulfurtransferase
MVERIDVDRVIELVADGATLIDVLPAVTYDQEHLPGAVSIPLETFRADDVVTFDRKAPVVLYCFDQHCDLSARASRRFEVEGFTEVYDLIGGRATWTALGLPTEGSVGDRRRIAHYVEPATTVGVDGTIADVPDWDAPVAVAVVADDGTLLGSVDASARNLPGDTPVARAMAPAPGTIRPELRIEEVAKRLRDDSLDHIFVTTVSGVLLGVVVPDRLHA